METNDWLLILATAFSGAAGLIAALTNMRVSVIKAQNEVLHAQNTIMQTDITAQAADIKTLEKNTNHKLDALLVTTEAAARAEGQIAGRAAEKADVKARRTPLKK